MRLVFLFVNALLVLSQAAYAQDIPGLVTTNGYKIPVPVGMEVVSDPATLKVFLSSPKGQISQSPEAKPTIDGVLRHKGDKSFSKGCAVFSWYQASAQLDLSTPDNAHKSVQMIMARLLVALEVQPRGVEQKSLGGLDFFWAGGEPKADPSKNLQVLMGSNNKTRRIYQVTAASTSPKEALTFKNLIPKIVPR